MVAAVLGTALGVGFGSVAYEAVVKPALNEATMQIPWPALAAAALTASLAGLLASVLPARRATLVTPAGVSLD